MRIMHIISILLAISTSFLTVMALRYLGGWETFWCIALALVILARTRGDDE